MRNTIAAFSINTISSILAGLVLHWITLPSVDDVIQPATNMSLSVTETLAAR